MNNFSCSFVQNTKNLETEHMKNPQLILKPKLGLGNRIRAVSSFIYLKKLINAELQVIWQPDKSLNAKYNDIFKENPNFSLLKPQFKYNLFINRKKLVNSKYGFIKFIVGSYNSLIKRLIGVDVLLLDNDIHNNLQSVKEICEKNIKILIITSNQCLEYKEGVQTFVPVDEIANMINRTLTGFKKNMIGIHIRRTDHIISIQNSPIYLYENKILDYIKKNDNFGIFLATDDPEIENYFIEKYPGIVITYKKIFGRDTKEGISDAVVDLFLLSKTNKIYGSYWSSYSGIASLLGDIELEVLHL